VKQSNEIKSRYFKLSIVTHVSTHSYAHNHDTLTNVPVR